MDKRLIEFGVARSQNIINEAARANVSVTDVARGYTYTTRDDDFFSTPLVIPHNPFNAEVLAAKNILEIGCGVGRNLPWVYENTQAHYWGVDPNPVMLREFWNVTDTKYADRATIVADFSELPRDLVVDVVEVVFVFQHLGYRNPQEGMNVTEITREAMKFTRPGTIWWILEHEREERWMGRWFEDIGIEPDAFEFNYQGIPEMTHRGSDSHLVIWKQR